MKMGMRNKIIRILRNTDTQRINFGFTATDGDSVKINGASFRRVADAIEKNDIKVRFGGVPHGVAKYSAWLDGKSAGNTIYIGKANYSSRDFDALMVHESVHAFFDLTRTSIQWVDNEAAAYVSQGFYLRNSGYAQKRMSTTGMPYLGRMLVNAIKEGESANSFWMTQLIDALKTNDRYQGYIHTCFHGDG